MYTSILCVRIFIEICGFCDVNAFVILLSLSVEHQYVENSGIYTVDKRRKEYSECIYHTKFVIFFLLKIGFDIRYILNLESENTSFSKNSEMIMDESHVRI